MSGELHDRVFSAGIEHDSSLVPCHSTDHLTVGAPTDLGAVIRHVREGDDSIICPILMDVPHLDRLVDGVGGKQVFARLVPLHREALAVMGLQLHVGFNSVRAFFVLGAFLVIEDPELGHAVVGAGG